MAEIGVIGSGSWGTALALVLNKNGHHVTIWSYLKEEADEIRKSGKIQVSFRAFISRRRSRSQQICREVWKEKMWSFLQFRLWQPELRQRKCARM